MPVNREKAVGAELGEREGGWEVDDVILYHLGIGAGANATDPKELEYTYEKDLKVLPSFVVVAGGRRPSAGSIQGFSIPGIEFNLAQLLQDTNRLSEAEPRTLSRAVARARARLGIVLESCQEGPERQQSSGRMGF